MAAATRTLDLAREVSKLFGLPPPLRGRAGERGYLLRRQMLSASARSALPLLPLPQFRQHPRHQIEPRRDRAGVDVFVAGVIAPAGKAKALDHDGLAAAVGIAGVGGAAG